MRGISAVIVVILLLMISISLTALAYFFFTGIFTTTTEAGTEAVEQITSSMLAQMRIESIGDNKVYIRNNGQTDLTNFSVYVNDELANFDAPSLIAQGEIGNITIYDFIRENDVIKVTSGEGAIANKNAPDPCESSNVVLCMKFDEGSGTTAKDSSSYGNDGAISDPTNMWSSTNCISGSCLSFDGSNDYVTINDKPELRMVGTDFTVEGWIFPTDNSVSFQGIVCKGKANSAGWNIIYYGPIETTRLWWSDGTADNKWANNNKAPLNTWTHFTVVYHRNGGPPNEYVDFYFNGKFDKSEPTTFIAEGVAPYVDMHLGWANSGWPTTSNFTGIIDEVRIYNKAIY